MMKESDTSLDQQRKKGIYLLPNLFTTLGLLSGFYAIIAAGQQHFEYAAIAIFVAMVFDILDGRVARLINAQSTFGAEYDSLSDMVSFGLAPALVMYEWRLSNLAEFGFGRLAWLSAFFYVACVALRLAKYNIQTEDDESCPKPHFFGLPCPAAAAVMASFIWIGDSMGLEGRWVVQFMLLLTLSTAGLMVSNVPYRSFKDIDLRSRISFPVMLMCVVVLFLLSFRPMYFLFLTMLIYMLSGPSRLLRTKSVSDLMFWRTKGREHPEDLS